MLKVRVIPTLLWKEVGLVKGTEFNSWRRIGSLLPAIKVYNNRDVDELMVMDILASQERKAPEYETVAEFSKECAVPLTVGGGITNLEQINQLLRAGADKVLINTAAYADLHFIKQAASCFGSQCIVAGIDAKMMSSGTYRCYSHSGTSLTEQEPASWAKVLADHGAGEILISSINRDGTMSGYDLPLIMKVVQAVDIPVIASGGAGTYADVCDVVLKTGVSAVAAASMFHFTEQTPAGTKAALEAVGVPIRKSFFIQGGFSK